MAFHKDNDLLPTTEYEDGPGPSVPASPVSTNSLVTTQQTSDMITISNEDQRLPASNIQIIFPPRSSSLWPQYNKSPQTVNTGFQLLQQSMLRRGKQKIVALLSPKTTSQTTEQITIDNSPEDSVTATQRERVNLIPVPGYKNKFCLSRGSPVQNCGTKNEKQLRVDRDVRERRNVTAESGRKSAELEEEGVDVRDFQHEYDLKKQEDKKVERMNVLQNAKATTLSRNLPDVPTMQKLIAEKN